MYSELTTEQRAAKAYNSVMSHGLSLKNKLDIVFDDFQEMIKNDLGEEGYEAIVKIINPVKRDDIEKIVSYHYDLVPNYEYKEYTKAELERTFELIFNDEEKEKIKNTLQEFLFPEYADEYLACAVADNYYGFFWKGNLELYLNKIILDLDVSLEPKIKEIIKKYEANSN